jgi:hypothetical protein
MKKGAVIAWLLLLFAGIALLFWRSEWIYSLPTPIPANYKDIQPGALMSLTEGGSRLLPVPSTTKKPLFLHFFNPDCPCSRFNMPHFRSLVKLYGQQVDFAIVMMSNKPYSAQKMRDKFDLPYPVPVLSDPSLAAACGVYSTPQAVIIDTGSRLYYRGNYNQSRYCSNEKTSFAKIALDGLLHNNPSRIFSPLAVKAYGCQLPTCKK